MFAKASTSLIRALIRCTPSNTNCISSAASVSSGIFRQRRFNVQNSIAVQREWLNFSATPPKGAVLPRPPASPARAIESFGCGATSDSAAFHRLFSGDEQHASVSQLARPRTPKVETVNAAGSESSLCHCGGAGVPCLARNPSNRKHPAEDDGRLQGGSTREVR
jgi:hypothetical protein